jgi:hypothetical protein
MHRRAAPSHESVATLHTMARQPERPARPWWLVPVVVVLAFFGVVFIVRLIVGFLAGIFTVIVVVALLVVGIYWFTTKD